MPDQNPWVDPLQCLADLRLPTRASKTLHNVGMDCEQYCRNRAHYRESHEDISYRFNSRGFRDHEWPDQLKGVIWCLGDSFTVGIGQPFEQIWPQLLAQRLKHRTLNISMDGASNAWIARRATQILTSQQPEVMILHWSFLHRREKTDADLCDEDRRIWHERSDHDLAEFQRCIDTVENANDRCCILHSAIPLFSTDAVVRQVFLRRRVGDRALPELEFQDHGRDGYHYGPKTAQRLVDNVLVRINTLDVDTLMAS